MLVSLLAFLMTLLGGVAAMRVRDNRHLVLGLSGGLMLGIVAFDLIPESLEMTRHSPFGVPAPMIGFAAGFVLLHVVEQAVAIHRAHEDEYAPRTSTPTGTAPGRPGWSRRSRSSCTACWTVSPSASASSPGPRWGPSWPSP